MEETREKARASRRIRREGFQSLIRKRLSKSDKASPPSQPSGVSVLKGGTRNAAPTDSPVTTEPGLQETSVGLSSNEPQNQAPDHVVETPDQLSTHPGISSFSSKDVDAHPDASQQPVVVEPTISEMLWDEAYRSAWRDDWRMVYRYETVLSLGLDRTAPDFENLISQRDDRARRAEMKELLDAWLSEANDEERDNNKEPRQEDGVDGGSQPTLSLRGIIRKVIEVTSAEPVLAWVGACYASEVRKSPFKSSKNLLTQT